MPNTVTQISILNALLAQRFDGQFPCGGLLEHGSLGIGTFDKMDGELIMLDGVLYQGMGDGRIQTPDPGNRTPFATVCDFSAEVSWVLESAVDYAGLDQQIDARATNPNVIQAIRIDGYFANVKLQALQKQKKPYPPTAEVVRGCARSEFHNVMGTIVGFRGVPYIRGINDTGYHLHFLTHDKQIGGHLLEFMMVRGTCAIAACPRHVVILPGGGADLAGIDMSKDLVGAFHAALENRA
jgi:acetolactate decarboxylase